MTSSIDAIESTKKSSGLHSKKQQVPRPGSAADSPRSETATTGDVVCLRRKKESVPGREQARNAEPQQLKWNPARLSIGEEDRDLPVFVGEHALSRLRERIPILIDVNPLNFMLHDALVEPKLRPTEGDDGFLVEAGPPGRNLGYFVAEIHDDFVFVRTLFFTMQGTPEARCLRHKLGLAKDLEYYQLAYSRSPGRTWGTILRFGVRYAECGCDYLLDFSTPTRPLSWLKPYREPLVTNSGCQSARNRAMIRFRIEPATLKSVA